MAKFSTYPPLDGLVDLACRDGVDIRPTLLRVITDLYVQKAAHSAEEETQYVELARGLIKSVDAPTRAAVAATLSAYPAAPAAILAKLGGAAATPGARADAEAAPDLTELFFAANAQERCLILTNLDVLADAPPHRPTPAAGEVIGRLENAALQRNTGEFSRVLEHALGINRALSERIARDYSGEPIVVAAKALGMQAAVLQRILLFLNPVVGQSIERVYELARLYDELTSSAAERMLTIWRQSGGARQPKHEPQYWDDERSDARSRATPARHQGTRREAQQPSRFKANER